MTLDQINTLGMFVARAKDMLGDLTILKERIAWLEGDKQLRIDLKHRHGEYTTVELKIPGEIEKVIRDMILVSYRSQLSDLEGKFDAMSVPSTNGE